MSLPCVRGGAEWNEAEGLCLTETIFFFFLQTPNFYNPSGAVASAPFTGGSLLFVRTLRIDVYFCKSPAPSMSWRADFDAEVPSLRAGVFDPSSAAQGLYLA